MGYSGRMDDRDKILPRARRLPLHTCSNLSPLPMSNDKETNGKLLTDADVERMKGDVQKWMREPEQWRQLLTHRFNSLLADRHARIEQNRKGIETMFEKMCELDTPKRGELHLLLISLFS